MTADRDRLAALVALKEFPAGIRKDLRATVQQVADLYDDDPRRNAIVAAASLPAEVVERGLDQLEAALDALERLLPAEGAPVEWQPIETAPKDGTWILAWGIDGSLQRVSWGRTRNDELQWCTAHGWCAFRYLTHWMPLPTAPDSVRGGAGR